MKSKATDALNNYKSTVSHTKEQLNTLHTEIIDLKKALQDLLDGNTDSVAVDEMIAKGESLSFLAYLILAYLSHLILSYLILSYLILSYLILLSYLISSYLILAYLILAYLSHLILFLSYLILS